MRQGSARGGRPFARGYLYRMLSNAIYIGQIVHKGVAHPGLHPAIIDSDVWGAVQERLALNLNSHELRSGAAAPSLLAGLVFDDRGHRLQPSHTKKGARRYRYYFVAAAHSQGERSLRIPAPELEGAVITALVKHLRDEVRVMGGGGDVREVEGRLKAAAELAGELERVPTSIGSNWSSGWWCASRWRLSSLRSWFARRTR